MWRAFFFKYIFWFKLKKLLLMLMQKTPKDGEIQNIERLSIRLSLRRTNGISVQIKKQRMEKDISLNVNIQCIWACICTRNLKIHVMIAFYISENWIIKSVYRSWVETFTNKNSFRILKWVKVQFWEQTLRLNH